MRRLLTSAAVTLGVALLAPVLTAQVRSVPAPNGTPTTGRSVFRPAAPLGHAGVMPTPMGVSPAPAPGFPAPTPMGVPPMLPTPGTIPLTSKDVFDGGFHRHRHRRDFFVGAYPVYVPVPVVVEPGSAYDSASEAMDQQDDDQVVVPGPTVFERRTPEEMPDSAGWAESARPAAETGAPAPASAAEGNSAADTAEPSDPAVLVFRDGHQLEIQNYAIVGDLLYDFTLGHARKVPLSQLDLQATVKANDDRGVEFALPAAVKSQ